MSLDIVIRSARAGEGQRLYGITAAAIGAKAAGHYSAEQIGGWMNGRDAAHYEDVIAAGAVRVAERDGVLLGFVDSVPGVVTRLFVLPEAAGMGLGRKLLETGITMARRGHDGVVRLEATLNAVLFYEKCGFIAVGRSIYRHPLGGVAVEVVNMEMAPAGDAGAI